MADSGGKTIDEIDDLFELVNHMNMLGINVKGLGLYSLEALKYHAKEKLSERNESQGLSAGKVWILKYYLKWNLSDWICITPSFTNECSGQMSVEHL